MIRFYIAVMDYSDGKIKMYTAEFVNECQGEDIDIDNSTIEEWLCNNTDYNYSTCYFMFSKNKIEVKYV